MPLEVHDYLVAQGWGGKGTGLRQGAISRPLAIPMKKNLAGLGKDRDEAFPFWDHLYTAAAKSITIKYVSEDEGDDGDEASTSNNIPLKKTSTGIFSTRRPVDGTPADSGNTTPTEVDSDSQTSRLSLMAQAQREAAKRRLYAKFFRGPVLGPETMAEEEKRLAALVQAAFAKENSAVQSMTVTEHIEIQTATERTVIDLEVSEKKRKGNATSGGEEEDDDARKERKRRRKAEKRKKEEKDASKLKRKKDKKEKKKTVEGSLEGNQSSSSKHSKRHKTDCDVSDKDENRQKKDEKRRIKALRKQLSVVAINPAQEGKVTSLNIESTNTPKEKSSPRNALKSDVEDSDQPDKKKKKKRKREDNDDSC